MGNLEPPESGRLRNNRPEVFSVYNFIKKETLAEIVNLAKFLRTPF